VECPEVFLLLSEYVDDGLDPVTRGLVEEHLTACASCAEELRSLQAYLRAMADMEKVGAPTHFLAAVHERLKRPSIPERLVKWLFYPWKIKLPMELAGIALATLLLVFAYQAPRLEKAQSPSSVSNEVRQSALPIEKKEASSDKAAVGRSLAAARRVKLALLLPGPSMPEYAAKQRPLSAAPPTEGKLESGRKKVREPITRQPSTHLDSASPAPLKAAEKDASVPPLDLHQAYELIKESAAGLGGTVLSASYGMATNEVKTILVRLPAGSYPRFLENLRRTGRLLKTSEEPAETKETAGDNEPIEVQIELIPPQ